MVIGKRGGEELGCKDEHPGSILLALLMTRKACGSAIRRQTSKTKRSK